jgi:hypothetical protein
MSKFLVIIIFSALVLEVSVSSKSNESQIFIGLDTIITFSHHIKLIGQRSKEFGGSSFNPIEVFFNDKRIFIDTSNEYWLSGFESNQYPKLLECSNGETQLLLEVDERPNINELQQITISNDSKIKLHRLPIFKWDPEDIDNDRKMELRGVLTSGETIADGDTAFYNPVLVYELLNNCLVLDSTATEGINKRIWGNFYGYYYNDSLLLPYKQEEF